MRDQGTNLHFYFIRHGQAEHNLNKEVVGELPRDADLTALGVRQSLALGRRLGAEKITADKIFSSTLKRAYQTACLIAPEVKYLRERIIAVSALNEMSHGQWEGRLRSEVHQTNTRVLMGDKGPWFSSPEGESFKRLQLRAARWLEEEILMAVHCLDMPVPRNILVVSHGGTLKAIFQWILNFDGSFLWKWKLKNASLSCLRFDGRGWWPKYIGDYGHLTGLK